MKATLILAAVAASVAVPAPGELSTFKNWVIGCDNGRNCKAVSLNDFSLADEVVTLVISRSGAPGAGAMIDVSGQFEEDVQSILLEGEGGKVLATLPLRNGSYAIPLDEPLLQALLAGQSVTAKSKAGNLLGQASLSGLSATLRAMDDRQKRVDTTSALVARGAKGESTVPAPPALPIISFRTPGSAAPQQLTKAEEERLRRETQCTDDEGEMAIAEAARIDPAKTLILLSCGHGAYNYSSMPYILSGAGKARSLKPARFDYDMGMGGEEGAMLVNAAWDDKSATLSTYDKGRGIGDCGTSASFVWDGSRFRLTDLRMMDDCRMAFDWPQLWHARAVRGK